MTDTTPTPPTTPSLPTVPPPDVIRCAYAELIVTDLAAARAFYVDVLGLVVTHEDDHALYLRAFEEYLHHSLIVRVGAVPALSVLAYRVRSEAELDVAEAYYRQLGVRVERRPAGATRGIGAAVRVEDPLGFPIEFFYTAEHTERFTQRYDMHPAGALARLDHFNVNTPDVPAARRYYEGLGFRVSEDIVDGDGTVYAAWLFRKPTVHDIALTGGDGPRLHHIAFAAQERHQILHVCDHLGALRQSDVIERGPGRHGVSNAFYLYLRDPDGHRIEIYTHDYYTGDPDNPVIHWDVHDNQRRDWWGNPVVPSWYTEASDVLDLDGRVQKVVPRTDSNEMDVTVGADGFSYAREGDTSTGFKLGTQI
ncbi:3,4-dihydroxyphenylacetate 2,3-dioxygenase [Actinobacteria bacterium YIM 96077]|uniref:3,4-dihydroxyphenylacetate 2,3-dioxygenase n=1 Tax=Phytoactinopolyspora halophila TaxID=1981511 RepID=A0A329QAK7_9ACTN|nr:3,4-dihydroxyphenylacetate 2,3-dioxygenase [Phytoactinopolyspora halophila]AYY12509.1 3,4-dihydroxyphenylacetate 2,3-dioxygenase [Actinobacteria bacterium YIM 96077]RAW09430.1 3,4-dihydroxyphenylacetate 2,3-dioxygenase [Phytoactinopolyspora halophila]